jgi:drug/metabolite transporter (DMT)-like permease
VIAIAGGLGAAVLWASSSLGSSRSSRMLPAGSVLSWIMLVGLLTDLMVSAGSAAPAPTGTGTWVLLAAAGVGNVLPSAWAVLPPRLVGVIAVAAPLALIGRLKLSRRAAPYLILSGMAEIAGFWSYSIGARQSIAVAAVLASMFASVTALGAYLLFHERLTRDQLLGVAIVAVAVAALTGSR